MPLDSLVVEGAVLLRPDVEFELREGAVVVERGPLLVDPGAVVHDPWRPLSALEPASPQGRPPFPYRPVVLFLGTAQDPDLADWVRRTVNGLVEHSTEGRIAVPNPTDGLHLTSPCAPTAATVAALAPDVVVALDDAALAASEQWLGRDRSAVVVELTWDTTAEVELVPWRIGHAHGRLRARIGRGIDAARLEALVRRLCAGPQALPPTDEPPPGLRIRSTRRSPVEVATTRVVALVDDTSDIGRFRYDGFAGQARAAGLALSVQVVDGRRPEVDSDVGIVMLRGLSGSAAAQVLANERRRAGRTTVVDLGPGDLLRSRDDQPGAPPELTPDAMQLVRAAGAATTTSKAVQERLDDDGIRALVLPTLWRSDRVAGLQRLRAKRRRTGPPVVGWYAGTGNGSEDAERLLPSSAITKLLDGRPDLTIEVVGDHTGIDVSLEAHPRVTIVAGDPARSTVARWTAQVWLTPAAQTEIDGEFRAVVEAHLLGVPSFTTPDSPPVLEGLVPSASTIGSPDDLTALAALLDDVSLQRRRADEAAQLAEALYGQSASATVMNRFRGWLSFGEPS